MTNRFVVSIGAAVTLSCACCAYQNPGTPTSFISDFTSTLTTDQRATLESTLENIKQNTGTEIAVCIIRDLGGDTIENFAEKLFKDWGIGTKGTDNGLLLLVALQDKKIRIEVGYGLEGTVTDAQSYRIIKDHIKPAFKQNNYYLGIQNAIQALAATLTEPPASKKPSTL